MPNLRSKTWTTTTPAEVTDAQYWEDHLISDAVAAKAASSVQRVNNTTPDENGNVTLSIPAVSVEENGTASSTVTHQQQIVINSTAADVVGTKYMEITSTASTFTFTNAAITANSVIDGPYVDTYGDNPSNVAVDGANNTCTVTFDESASRTVRIYIR